jgi:hypothetical protein
VASILLAESAIQNDNSGQLVGVINADTSTVTINNAKVQGLVNLGAHAFSGYPLTVGTDLPAKNESNYVANDNTGNLMSILNADTSTTTLSNAKLAGPLVSGITAGAGITVTGNPANGVGSPTVAVSTGTGGVPLIRAHTVESELTSTAATVVATYTPTATDGFYVLVFVRVVTAATAVTVTVTYDDAAGTAQTQTMLPTTTLAVGNFDMVGAFVVAGTSAAIDVNVTAGTANQVYASAVIVEM